MLFSIRAFVPILDGILYSTNTSYKCACSNGVGGCGVLACFQAEKRQSAIVCEKNESLLCLSVYCTVVGYCGLLYSKRNRSTHSRPKRMMIFID